MNSISNEHRVTLRDGRWRSRDGRARNIAGSSRERNATVTWRVLKFVYLSVRVSSDGMPAGQIESADKKPRVKLDEKSFSTNSRERGAPSTGSQPGDSRAFIYGMNNSRNDTHPVAEPTFLSN